MENGIDRWEEFFIRWWSITVFGFFQCAHAVHIPLAISSYSALVALVSLTNHGRRDCYAPLTTSLQGMPGTVRDSIVLLDAVVRQQQPIDYRTAAKARFPGTQTWSESPVEALRVLKQAAYLSLLFIDVAIIGTGYVGVVF
jgi:hypothetical protein